jgi:hypothetical protein
MKFSETIFLFFYLVSKPATVPDQRTWVMFGEVDEDLCEDRQQYEGVPATWGVFQIEREIEEVT